MGNEIKEIHKTYQLLRRLVKYGITALTVLCTIHCGLLVCGYDIFGVHILLCLFLFILGLCLSKLFGLCWAHKACVLYTCTVVLLVVFKRQNMFHVLGIDLDVARTVMYIIGVFIIGYVTWKIHGKNC